MHKALALCAAMTLAVPAWAGKASCEASWYGGGEALSTHTASGEVFRPNGLTAAHRSLPFGSLVKVTIGERSVVVRINDRGPHHSTGRCIDLSRGSAQALGMIGSGVARVKLTILN